MTNLPGLGPQACRRLYDELGIDSLEALKEAGESRAPARRARLRAEVRGGRAGGLRRGRSRRARRRPRMLLSPRAGAGRRHRGGAARPSGVRPRRDRRLGAALADSVKDLDIIATADGPAGAARRARRARRRRVVVLPGVGAGRARTHSGLSVDLRVVEPDQFGNLLQHFTGSKAHNVALRGRRCAAACTCRSTG